MVFYRAPSGMGFRSHLALPRPDDREGLRPRAAHGLGLFRGARALQAAVRSALEEDPRGTVSMDTIKRINEAVAKLRNQFMKNASRFNLGPDGGAVYLSAMASLSRMLNDPSMKRFLERFRDNEGRGPSAT